MSKYQDNIFKSFNKTGCRWIISTIFKTISTLKNKIFIDFRYDKKNKRWLQYYRRKCFYVDIKPNWNINPLLLEKRVNQIDFFQYNPCPGDVIFDIGAGVGTESIFFSQKVGTGKIYSIEAHPDTFKSLQLLVDVAKIQNIIPVNIAIGDKSGIVYINSRENHVENSIQKTDIQNGIKINCQSLDEFVEINGIKKINFLRMNIEGAEMDAIKGMTESIKIIDNIAVSAHDFLFENNSTKIKDTIYDFLNKNSFLITTRLTDDIVTDSWIYGKNIKYSKDTVFTGTLEVFGKIL